MDVKKLVSENSFVLVLLFAAAGVIASSINLFKVWGSSGGTFTLFEFLGPLPAAFLGPVLGIAAILIAKFASVIMLGQPIGIETGIRMLPVLFAAYFFATYKSNSSNRKLFQVGVPLACMALFIAHPIGGQAWIYSLYWLIPPISVLLLPKNIFFRSLGTTFTQHAIGGTIWLYLVNPMTPAIWLALIPVVAIERLVFAGGISVSYLSVNAILSKVSFIAKSRHIRLSPLPFSKGN